MVHVTAGMKPCLHSHVLHPDQHPTVTHAGYSKSHSSVASGQVSATQAHQTQLCIPELLFGIFTDAIDCALVDIAVIAIFVQPKQAEHIGDNDVILLWIVMDQLLVV